MPSTVDATGAKDVTADLNAFFARVPDGSTVSFPAGGRYRIESTLYLYHRNNLTINGNGALFFATTTGSTATPPAAVGSNPSPPLLVWTSWPRHRNHWLFLGGSNIHVSGITVKGPNPYAGANSQAFQASLEAQAGVEFAGVAGAVLDGSTISGTYGDFVTVSFGSTDVVIRNNNLQRSGRQGVTVSKGYRVLVDSNLVAETGRSAFDVEPGTVNGASDITISNNDVGVAKNVFFANLGTGVIKNVTISGNRLHGEPMDMVIGASDGARRANYKILNNTSDTQDASPVALLRFLRVDGLTVSGNYQKVGARQVDPKTGRVNHAGVAVGTTESCSVSVTGNTFPGATIILAQTGPVC